MSTKRPLETLGSDFKYEPCKVVAEIGCNHMGSMEIAKELMKLAKECGSTYAKFQKRCPKELLTPAQYAAPHPNPRNSYGDTYGAHREFLELTVDQHRELKVHCDEIGLGYSCSVWDITSAKEIVSLNPDLIKVSAAGKGGARSGGGAGARASQPPRRTSPPPDRPSPRWRL